MIKAIFNPLSGKLDFVSKENILDGTTAGQMAFWNGSTWTYTDKMFWDNTNKRLGIGTATPVEQLQISKNFRMPLCTTGEEGIIYMAHDRFLHAFELPGTTGRNIFLGINAGNFTMTGATGDQGSNLVGIGRLACSRNTTGYFNIGIGAGALQENTTGNRNTAVGGLALYKTTTGQQNFGLGYGAGQEITTGNYNFAIGSPALGNVTDKSSNIAIGNWCLHAGNPARTIGIGQTAARYLADGSTATTGLTNGVYIGHEARAGAVSATNEIVIGRQAEGNGNNTVTLGNSDITNVHTHGVMNAGGYKSSDGSAGISTTFTNGDGDTVTVKDGLITDIS